MADAAWRIRPFSADDQTAVRHLILEGLGEHFGTIDASLNPDLGDIWQNYMLRGHTLLVVEINGALVGAGALVAETADTGRIVRVSVSQTHRRQGIAGHRPRPGRAPTTNGPPPWLPPRSG